jgi:hypothetical protein
MDAYNKAVDQIGASIIAWSDPDGTFRANREVRCFTALKQVMDFLTSRIFNSLASLFDSSEKKLGMVVV